MGSLEVQVSCEGRGKRSFLFRMDLKVLTADLKTSVY